MGFTACAAQPEADFIDEQARLNERHCMEGRVLFRVSRDEGGPAYR